MKSYVVDASVAVKWVVDETDSARAVALLDQSLSAPDLLIPECANILWKKVARKELRAEEAELAAETLEQVEIDLHPTRALLRRTTQLAVALNHPAYDCVYVALAEALTCPLVTADRPLIKAIQRQPKLCRAKLLALDEFTVAWEK